jgi:putative nucleotidyltransferase with HDIG domain
MAIKLDHLVQQIGSLPTLPTVIVQVNELVNNPKTSALDLARTILEDQALTARLLRLVNSPFYGFPRRIATVTEAVTILGFHPVRNLLLTASVVDLLVSEETPEFSPTALWEHSVGTAVGAGILARYSRHEDREEVFVAGLLHDVGKLVLFHFQPKEFIRILETARAENLAIRATEQRVLGFTHDQVGRLLAERWKLPVRLSEAVACHHRPDLAQVGKREASLVHVSDVLTRALGLGSGGDDAVPPLESESWRRLGLQSSVVEPLMAEMEEQYADARAVLLNSLDRRPRQAAGAGHVS